MDQAGVDMALSWQNPAVTRYGSDIEENYRSLEAANRYISRFSGQHPTRIIPQAGRIRKRSESPAPSTSSGFASRNSAFRWSR
jgi:hypothetical protein